jgi:general secretion pathway protein B
MSYILDALRRADAERERDPGRGIHAHPVPLPAESSRRLPLWIVALAVALVLLVAGALLLRPAPRVALDLNMPPPNAPVAKQPPVVAPPVMPVSAEVSPPAPAPQAVERAPERPIVKAHAAPARTAPAAPVAAAPAPVTPVIPPEPVPAANPAQDRVLAISELPPDIQRELPKLQISGGVYSDNPAQRMLIVGGQVVPEGGEAAAGVAVEQIRAKSAVLRFRGYRFSVQY